jgi:hypothetical protein
MLCARCGVAEARSITTVIALGDDREFIGAVENELRRQGIREINDLGQLCEQCWEVAEAAVQEGARLHAAAHREELYDQHEKNLGRPLTSAERNDIDAYLEK